MVLRWLALVCVVFLLAACSADSGSREAPTPTEPESAAPSPTPSVEVDLPPRPRAGECHRLSLDEATAPTNEAAPVPCRKRHTAVTFHVGQLDLVDRGHRLAVDSRAAQAQPRRVCTRRLSSHLGITGAEFRLTMAQTVWFTPTVEEAAAGADWFRCDLVVVSRPGKLAPLPARTRGLGTSPTIAMCATSRPGAKEFARVACRQDHAWRAVATVDLPGPRFPSLQAVSAAMSDRCRDLARDHSDDPLDFDWSEERPTRAQWQAGQRHGICWVPVGS
jgi:hypothetical protein